MSQVLDVCGGGVGTWVGSDPWRSRSPGTDSGRPWAVQGFQSERLSCKISLGLPRPEQCDFNKVKAWHFYSFYYDKVFSHMKWKEPERIHPNSAG